MCPAGDGAAELAGLRWAVRVLEVDAEARHELFGEGGIVDGVDRPEDFLGVLRHADLAVGVASLQEAQQLGPATVGEAFVGLGE